MTPSMPLRTRTISSRPYLGRCLAACAGVVLLVLLPLAASAATSDETVEPHPGPDGTFTIHFEDVELPVFIKFIAKATGRNFVFSDKVTGTVTVISPTPVTASEALTVFQSVLATRGLTTIDDGVVTRIVPLREARTSGGVLLDGKAPTAGFATRLIPLQHVDAAQIASAVQSLVSKEGSLAAYPATNTLIVTETVANLDRIASVVKALDIPSHEKSVEVIPLDHADAEQLADHITDILGEQDRRGGKDRGTETENFKIVPDERTNSLVVIAGPVELRQIRRLVAGLDTPLREDDSRIHVYYAKYADARSLVDVVSGMISGRRRIQTRGNQTRGETRAAAGTSVGLGEMISVTADAATNSVVINSSPADFVTIKALLDQLDIERPQVFVEAIVAEISVDRTQALGIELQGGGDIGQGVGLGRTNLSNLNAALGLTNPASLGGLILAAVSDKTITLPDGTEVPASAALFQALSNDTDINILSAPTLLTLDNQEAQILVGQNVPFITSQGVDTANIGNVFTTVERKDVGIKLKLTPQVSEGETVTLHVEEEVSALVQSALLEASQVGPTTRVRSATTTVSVRDGRTAVIGGLISDSLTRADSKVPYLGDLPVLGKLFRFESDRKEKVNLIVFLTPHIVRNSSDLARVSAERKKRYEEQSPKEERKVTDRTVHALERIPDLGSDEQHGMDPGRLFPLHPRPQDGGGNS
jgi:general secretion pathway protein D